MSAEGERSFRDEIDSVVHSATSKPKAKAGGKGKGKGKPGTTHLQMIGDADKAVTEIAEEMMGTVMAQAKEARELFVKLKHCDFAGEDLKNQLKAHSTVMETAHVALQKLVQVDKSSDVDSYQKIFDLVEKRKAYYEPRRDSAKKFVAGMKGKPKKKAASTRMDTCTQTPKHPCTHTHAQTQICTYSRTCTCTPTNAQMLATPPTHAHTPAHKCMHIKACTCMRSFTRARTCTCAHTFNVRAHSPDTHRC
jgi:hypothetical protein